MIILCVGLYLLHVILTYFVQRAILKLEGERAQYHPHGFMMILMFIPIIGLITSLIALGEVYLNKKDYKKVYHIE